MTNTTTDSKYSLSQNMTNLLAQLKDSDWQTRWKAVERLGQSSDLRVVEHIIPMLEDEHWSVRMKTAQMLRNDIRAIVPLVKALNDENKDVRQAVVQSLIHLGSEAIEPLLQLLSDIGVTTPETRKDAIRVLNRIGDERVIPVLVKTLGDPNLSVRKTAAESIKKIGSPAVDSLAKAVASKDGDVQWRAVEALGEIGDVRAVVALVEGMNDDDADVRLKAAEVLDNLGWKATKAEEQIAYAIAKEQWDDLLPFGAQTVPFLTPISNDKEFKVREQAAATLAKIFNVIEQIVFGDITLPEQNQTTTLRNPDTAELTIPMSSLRTIQINTETYDFHLAERFMTYAINHIGQEHLKKQVEVHIYGDPGKIHLNLRNSFDNLCARVETH